MTQGHMTAIAKRCQSSWKLVICLWWKKNSPTSAAAKASTCVSMENTSNQSTFVLSANCMATEHFYIHVHVHVHVGAVKHKPASCFSVSFGPFAFHLVTTSCNNCNGDWTTLLLQCKCWRCGYKQKTLLIECYNHKFRFLAYIWTRSKYLGEKKDGAIIYVAKYKKTGEFLSL